nr:hypothetical protein PJ912_12200 [Pectobacterium colocasium]
MQLPQFNTQKDKWDYLISVPEISPKNKSERNFYIELKKIINSNEVIPDYYRNRFVIIIEKLIDNAKNDFYKTEYKELMLEITK